MDNIKVGVVGLPGNWSSEELVTVLKERTGYGILIDMECVFMNLTKNQVLFGDLDLRTLDGIIIKKLGAEYSPYLQDRLEILRFLSETGVKIFSKPESIALLLDRLHCTVRLQQGGIPIPPTVITENIDVAEQAIQDFGKVVLKPLYTSKARGMKLLENNKSLREELKAYKCSGNKIFYIQKLVPIPGRDLGLVFLGGEYLATYSRVAQKDSWNTTTASGGKYEPYSPSLEVIELAQKAQALFDLDFTCADLVETPDGPLVFEVSAFGGFRGLLDAHNMKAAEIYSEYVLNNITAEHNVIKCT